MSRERKRADGYLYDSPHRETAEKSRARAKNYDAATKELRERHREEFNEIYEEVRNRPVETS